MSKDGIIAAIAMLKGNGTLRRIADVPNQGLHDGTRMHKDANPPRSRPKARHKPYVAWRCIKAGQIRETGKMHRTPLSEIIDFAAPSIVSRPLPCPNPSPTLS